MNHSLSGALEFNNIFKSKLKTFIYFVNHCVDVKLSLKGNKTGKRPF